MNKLFKTALILLIPGGMVIGQAGVTSNTNATKAALAETNQLDKALGLIAIQVARVQEINTSYEAKLENLLINSANYTDAEILTNLKELRASHETTLEAEFTQDQLEKYKNLLAKKNNQ